MPALIQAVTEKQITTRLKKLIDPEVLSSNEIG
jgi:hypothetical protein